jgi:aryl-alcohol dehydrogenase-like predicted oxidoreductase
VGLDKVVLGCGNFGGIGSDLSLVGEGETEDEAFALMDAAWARGVRRFDTASSYGGGRSERAIGTWIASRRPEGLALTSKVFHPVRDGDDSGLGAERVRRVVHESLAQLGVERIDLYLIHEPDPATPLAETLTALDALVEEGVLGAIGVSNADGAYLAEAVSLGRLAAVQNEYSLLARDAERDVLPLCAEHGIEFQCFSPLAGGWLTGKYRRDQPFPEGSRMTLRPDVYEGFMRGEVFDRLEELEARAAARGVEPAALALAWLLSSPAVGAVVVGPRRPAQLETVWAALELPLEDGERAELSELFA